MYLKLILLYYETIKKINNYDNKINYEIKKEENIKYNVDYYIKILNENVLLL
jgi:hypothetical protein